MGLQGEQVVHRPGPFNQPNKAHKPSKGKRSRRNKKGRLDVKAISRAKTHELHRKDRRNRANQLRKNKRDELKMKRRGVEDLNSPPILVGLLSLNRLNNPSIFLDGMKSCTRDIIVSSSEKFGYCHINYPRQKQRFTFIIPEKTDLHSIMDTVKIAEILIIVHSSEAANDEDTQSLLSVILAHALPTTMHVVQGLNKLNPKKKAEIKKSILKEMETRFPDEKLYQADYEHEFQMILRQMSCQKQRSVSFRDARPHLLAENVEYCANNDMAGVGTLKVTGYIRGKALNVNGLLHIPGWTDYQMCEIDYRDDPHPLIVKTAKFIASKSETEEINMEGLMRSDKVDTNVQESLQSEIIPDPMEGEQTWPTQEELDAAEQGEKKDVKKVAEGTSDYQASWIIDSENSEESDSEEEDSETEEQEDIEVEEQEDSMSQNNENMDCEKVEENNSVDIKDDIYDKEIDLDAERKMMVRFKEEKMNQQFPDEVDTPIDISARIKYQKYRGLKNFNSSPWDPMENLPLDYARIYRFQNFRQTKKKVLNVERDGALPGSYVTIHIANVPQSLYDSLTDSSPLVVYGLLTHEQKMSVMNVVIKKHPSCNKSVMSKDSLIFHVGFRRFTCKPIFSEHRRGNKFKYERFLPSDAVVVASFYAPVTFPPASVVVFRQQQDGTPELVATGSLLDMNPNRVVVKRIVLSGHPFRIFKRSAIVRYMFFNPEDINWFKRIELQTKCGRRGHIKESLGTYGHMRCIFDDQLTSMDIALMCLYKRVFPKWSFDHTVPTPVKESDMNDLESLM